ncbi:RNA polymerase sigma factor (sigma-70 family) [Actinoplanes lutulentus]|uniref:RNA polymerase sigma factor (Sigma-70 family) n=1 Tax=Actinoplanes lutulentus TaxID=1287878 RepID=A0A327ZBJ6_9ACTN|nr:sigma-70 family RNA polymerase sigma factor [Actinoplanes lutulentus]MBB2947407.1 RNA polymerase sigma factor (sigma-70 family) [Actinoplanes lutulentus]RAK36681.1 RNA polymerase sigma factor (sigma-70 family) [Actinoplanes lutulentus]
MGPVTALPDLLRECAPRVLAAVVRRYGDFEACEDAVQEALLAAAQQWPREGVPEQPRHWLITVASRRRVEMLRSETARRRREEAVRHDPEPQVRGDDELALLLLCCHPSLTVPAQVTLTLRAVGGLSTAEIARALLLPEATVGQRISRAKQRIRDTGARFEMPAPGAPLDAVLHVLYLIFTEGHTASSGDTVNRVELTREAIRLTRQLHRRLPDDGEVAGLLALMLLTDARRSARTQGGGSLVPLAEQDRRRWDAPAIAEGVAIITHALAHAPIGPFQLQAAIAAVHDEATRAELTDWPQILLLYGMLHALAPSPMVALNRIVARAMVDGPRVALTDLDQIAGDPALARHHRTAAVRAHLLEMAGERDEAREQYRLAARLTLSGPEQRYLESRAARLRPGVYRPEDGKSQQA